MISRLSGRLVEKAPPAVVVDVNGVGYELDVPMSTFYHLPATGQAVTLFTHLVVREDAHLLFGFGTEAERQVFRTLLKITGVGTRIALALLSGLSVDELHATVATQDTARLVRIPGIGKKTAERLLLELKDRLAVVAPTTGRASAVADGGHDALNALVALGYSDREARAALAKLAPDLPLQDAIRQALRALSKV
ncbi:MAG: Holliday junction branch migration protein RuvA [Burkholderiales bacterium]|jgi:holliday junction DNA helicase RuvA|nr:Holliday junction branch migration protein RuvA [Burkholderiales bacterium]